MRNPWRGFFDWTSLLWVLACVFIVLVIVVLGAFMLWVMDALAAPAPTFTLHEIVDPADYDGWRNSPLPVARILAHMDSLGGTWAVVRCDTDPVKWWYSVAFELGGERETGHWVTNALSREVFDWPTWEARPNAVGEWTCFVRFDGTLVPDCGTFGVVDVGGERQCELP